MATRLETHRTLFAPVDALDERDDLLGIAGDGAARRFLHELSETRGLDRTQRRFVFPADQKFPEFGRERLGLRA
jgi:hypothetical protein